MRINKKLLKIITIAILIGSIALIYGFNNLRTYKEKMNRNVLNTAEKLDITKQKKNSKPQQSVKSPIKASTKTEKPVSKPIFTNVVNNNKIPILMYHSISYEKGNTLRISKENFRNQMKYLKYNNYTTLTLDELYSYMKENKNLPNKSIVITFDDGYKDNYTNAYPILKEFNLKATVFVITNAIDKDKNYLTSDEIKLMDKNNVRIESHTAAHEHLDKITFMDNVKSMTASKSELEKILNRKINYIAYPFGEYNLSTIKAAKQTGYKLAFSTEYGWINKNNNIYSLGRIFVSSTYDLQKFKSKLNPDLKSR
ncbi:polysaccharide deacetylase family protein [Clostridium algoriphilum]|uniref:polysaccharide deacetylase family protein n=1 Tax=Clostridium algoriphilum TaxID=198347 RepID=UPI001CF17D1F|nr:polysaccharide deacetylase family protein [Clostridium algoriphilum]MCB2295571.1 polysaccharide deacetylase family protein [Clostridium algoriphilum]